VAFEETVFLVFPEIIKDLKKRFIPILKMDSRNYRLQRLRMGKDGNLFVLKEEERKEEEENGCSVQ
jgi:hypothetical protein